MSNDSPAPCPGATTHTAPSVASIVAIGQVQATPGINLHFEQIGGADAVARLVEAFYGYMDRLPEAKGIRAMHEADLAPVKAILRRYLTEWLGGPALYSVERGHPRLRRKHLPFPIGVAERDAWLQCMTRALDDVVADSTLKDQLTRAFFKTADFIRNDQKE